MTILVNGQKKRVGLALSGGGFRAAGGLGRHGVTLRVDPVF